jgi:hypothetical protein
VIRSTEGEAKSSSWVPVIGTLLGTLIGLTFGYCEHREDRKQTSADHSADREHALRMKRYELTHVEAAKAYLALLESLNRTQDASTIWNEQSGHGARQSPEMKKLFADTVEDVKRKAQMLDPFLDPRWRKWLSHEAQEYAQLLIEEPHYSSTTYLDNEIRTGLWLRLFSRDQPDENMPTPIPHEYDPTPGLPTKPPLTPAAR